MRWQRGLWLFLVPSFGLMTVVLLWPLAYAAYLSTFDYYLGSREMRFVGLANYAQLLGEARLWQSLLTTVVIAFGSVGVEFVLGFTLAFCRTSSRLSWRPCS
jgi:multiple sugar transport system permease protein